MCSLQIVHSDSSLENLRVALSCQVAHKNCLVVAVTLAENCARWKDVKSVNAVDVERVSSCFVIACRSPRLERSIIAKQNIFVEIANQIKSRSYQGFLHVIKYTQPNDRQFTTLT